MTTCTRRLEIDYGHRLLKHEGKCRNVHGHRGVVDITCSGPLDGVGRVIDFSKVKEIVGGFLDCNLDHAFIAEVGDPIIPFLQQQTDFDHTKLHILSVPPTAENLAEYILEQARSLLSPLGITVTHIRFYETPNGWADAGSR